MKLRPLGDKILVKPAEAEGKTPSGLIIPDGAKEKPTRGEVLAVGTGRILPNGERAPMSVAPGQVAWYGKYAGTEIELDGQKLRIVSEDDVFGVEE